MVRLDRKYGFFRCRCPQRSVWESSHVYCVRGTKRVYFKQMCRRCRYARNPYRVEDIRCRYCDKAPCVCTFIDAMWRRRRRRNIDVRRPHRRDLCLKCIAGMLCLKHDEDIDVARRYRN